MLRVFEGYPKLITSHTHVEGEIPGHIRVIIDEDDEFRDPAAIVTTLLEIAQMIDAEAKRSADPDLDEFGLPKSQELNWPTKDE